MSQREHAERRGVFFHLSLLLEKNEKDFSFSHLAHAGLALLVSAHGRDDDRRVAAGCCCEREGERKREIEGFLVEVGGEKNSEFFFPVLQNPKKL